MTTNLTMTAFLLATDCKLVRFSKRKDHLAVYWCSTCGVSKKGKRRALDGIIERKPAATK